jgi:hypothetical protein
MNDPKRWSHPASDVDPVLRSVLRYAQSCEPTSEELQQLVRGRSTPAAVRRLPRRTAWAVALVAVLACGAALAAHASGLLFNPSKASDVATPSPVTRSEPKPVTVALAPAVAPSALPPAPPPTSAQEAPSAPPVVSASRAPAASTAGAERPAVPDASTEQDAQLLQRAHAELSANPARALSLTRDHAVHFPDSPLLVEREALQIEALARLGRRNEAAAALAQFEARYPRSPYARRLHTLVEQ